MAGDLPFEMPLTEMRKKITELQQFGQEKGIDFSDEIARLEERYRIMENEVYASISPSQKMHIARHHGRPTSLDLIQLIFNDFIELHGDRMFGDDLAIVGGIGKLDGMPVTVIGQQRGKDTKDNIARFFGSPHPEGFRKALRLMKQADKFKRPIITLVDTKGAYPGNTAEERGQSEAIARNLSEMSQLSVPVICVIIGEGGSGGALALAVGNRVLMLEHAIYSVISPNGAASILWKDAGRADQAAEAMRITAPDLLDMEVVEEVVAEPKGGAHRDYEQTAANIKEALIRHLGDLLPMTAEELKEDRYLKFRKIGEFAEGQHTAGEEDLNVMSSGVISPDGQAGEETAAAAEMPAAPGEAAEPASIPVAAETEPKAGI